MKKRILAFLLSCTLMLGGTAEGIFAEPVSADTHLPAEITADTETEETESKTNEAESLMDDTAVQSAEAGESFPHTGQKFLKVLAGGQHPVNGQPQLFFIAAPTFGRRLFLIPLSPCLRLFNHRISILPAYLVIEPT